MAEVGMSRIHGPESGERVEARPVPGRIMHVCDRGFDCFVLAAGIAGLADDDLEALPGLDTNRLMAWSMTRRMYQADAVCHDFTVS